ncbi:MAG: RlmE family RNA methyltransferase [Desulfobacterales bacterium]|nr:RlmE family RNA methyltransferase [Desulfobacterales bacterium]MCP4158456.1 RlmE family RNA methyltransferase [Deltaproteobacteria bacterium]
MVKKKKNKKGNWEDHYTRKAKKDNFPARSVYKLQEIQKKFKIIKKGYKILDLGCSPGSWLKYAAELTTLSGLAYGIDLKEVTEKMPDHAKTFVCDILDYDNDLNKKIGTDFDIILSDMAPSTTGRKDIDAARSYNLCEMALTVSNERLKAGGHFVCKIFQGREFEEFVILVKKCFKSYKIFKPESCRKQSKEIYIIGLDKI